MSKKENNNVTVGVRVRPRNPKEIEAEMPVNFTTSLDGSNVQELDENGVVVKHWSYDHVFGPECTNMDIFQTMGSNLVDAAMEGYNTVMFMYGQTSSGKTFTLFGSNGIAGVVQHAMEHVYQRVKTSTDTEYVIKLTYAELYNEEIKDLLSPTPNENLKIIEDPNIGPLIQNITEASFTTASDVKIILEEGENRRHFGVTNMNAHSSRSHVIVRLHIESRKVTYKVSNALRSNWGKDRPNCVSTLNLVDLAGSERANKAGTSGQSLKEGSYINKSLLTLGTVIANLSEGKTQHIPYRNSKLTRLLATALGGNAKTTVITCISPASGNVAESLNTLRFASRAKRIVNQVQKNEIMDMRSLTNKLSMQLQEIEHLRHQVELSRQLGFSPDDGEAVGESLREKAIVTSRALRSTKFLIKKGPAIMNGLRGQGMSHLAKKVMVGIKMAINGEREISLIIDDFVTMVETYLPKDRHLLEQIQAIALHNEAEAIMNVHGGIAVDDSTFLDDQLDVEGDSLFDLLVSGGEEFKEVHESACMEHEEFRGVAVNKVVRFEQEIASIIQREKLLRKSLDEAQQSMVEQHENARHLKSNELVLHKQIDELKQQRKHDIQAHTDQLKKLNARIHDLQVKADEKEEKINEKSKDISSKESENDRLRNQVEQLIKDLNSAIASKKAFEEESSRARSEMRIQMDKLRNNMHEMLLQGGMEAKVIESQNEELQKEVDFLRDEKDRLTQTKENYELEMQQLQAALAASRDDGKAKLSEITSLRNENTDQAHKIRELRFKMAKIAVALTLNEEVNKSLQNQIKTEINLREESVEAKTKEMQVVRDKARLKLLDMQVEIDIRDAEVESLKDQLSQKLLFVSKLEQSFGSDVSRLEKKLASQSKLCEELIVENNNAAIQAQIVAQKHTEEIKVLKQKIQEQQAGLESISTFIDQQERLHQEEQHHDGDGRSTYGDGCGDYSPYSRSNSLMSSYRPSFAVTVDGDYDNFSGGSTSNTPMAQMHQNSFFSDVEVDQSSKNDYYASQEGKRVGLSVSVDLNQNNSFCEPESTEKDAVYTPIPTHRNWNEKSHIPESTHDVNDFLNIEQSRYDQVLFGLSMATALMELNLNQERQLRSFFVKSEYNYMEKLNSQQYQIEKLSDAEKQLMDTQYQLQESLRFNQSSQSSLQQRHAELESKYNEQQKEFYKVNKLEKVGNIHAKNLESSLYEQKVLFQIAKSDITRHEIESQDYRQRQLESESKLEYMTEQYNLMYSFCDVLQKEKIILAKEKEDLVKKCNEFISQRRRHGMDDEFSFSLPENEDDSHVEKQLFNHPGHPIPSDMTSIIEKYRHSRSVNIRTAAPTLQLSDSIGSRMGQNEPVNTLRTYALNTGLPITSMLSTTNNSQSSPTKFHYNSNRYSPQKRR